MKKVLLFVAVATLVSGTMVSCGKSSKGKMDGEWKVDSMKNTSTSTSGGSTSSNTMSIEGTVLTNTNTNGSTTSTSTGTVNTATWTIKKDGTWERVLAYTMTGTISGINYTNVTTITSSGNWDFAAGVGEFKKNERVIFSTTKQVEAGSNTMGGVTTTSTDTDTYLDGENSEVFVITESKGKSLSMESKGSNTSSNGSNTSTDTNETVVTMSL